jgi:hypothetical protein
LQLESHDLASNHDPRLSLMLPRFPLLILRSLLDCP